jgi:hypothetical protein
VDSRDGIVCLGGDVLGDVVRGGEARGVVLRAGLVLDGADPLGGVDSLLLGLPNQNLSVFCQLWSVRGDRT